MRLLAIAALLATAAADRAPAELPTWLIGRWCDDRPRAKPGPPAPQPAPGAAQNANPFLGSGLLETRLREMADSHDGCESWSLEGGTITNYDRIPLSGLPGPLVTTTYAIVNGKLRLREVVERKDIVPFRHVYRWRIVWQGHNDIIVAKTERGARILLRYRRVGDRLTRLTWRSGEPESEESVLTLSRE